MFHDWNMTGQLMSLTIPFYRIPGPFVNKPQNCSLHKTYLFICKFTSLTSIPWMCIKQSRGILLQTFFKKDWTLLAFGQGFSRSDPTCC